MIKVLIADDEPFIRDGLRVIINWEEYGFKICEEAANGKEALEILKTTTIDLVVLDIRMPEMNGLEFIRYVREHVSRDIKFIIISGYNNFEYAKQALKSNVLDYLLKPVQSDELITALKRVKEKLLVEQNDAKSIAQLKSNQIKNSIEGVIHGLYTEASLHLVKEYLDDPKNFRYILIRIEKNKRDQCLKNQVKIVKKCLQENISELLSKKECYFTEENILNDYAMEIGLLMLNGKGSLRDSAVIEKLYNECANSTEYQFYFYVGIQVEELKALNKSYKTAVKANVNQFVSKQKFDINYYEQLQLKESSRHTISYTKLEKLTLYVKENQVEKIKQIIEGIYEEIKDTLVEPELIQTNIRFILYSIVDLAKDSLGTLEQEEIMQYLDDEMIEEISYRGDARAFTQTVIEFSDYLYQLKNYSSTVVLSKVNKEIEEHYMDNLSLKSLGKKYFINNVYLGQVFKKEKGMSFKEYLNKVRIDKAAEMLIIGNDRIYSIAERVGYQNPDYFISKFVQMKGTTPHQYRMKRLNENKTKNG